MIHGVHANQPTFRAVELSPGLNVVMAERKEGSGKKDTRNSLGKSTLIQIINFCLGSSSANNPLCIDELQEWAFTLDLTLSGNRVKVTRSVENPNLVTVDGKTEGWKYQPTLDLDLNQYLFSLDEWKQLLGWSLFDLRQNDYGLTTRALLSYFIRSRTEIGEDPLKYFPSQPAGSVKLQSAFLLGLNWQYAGQWWGLQKQEEALDALKKAIKFEVHEDKGELETQKVQLEAELEKSQKSLSSFLVHDQYKDIEAEANSLTREIHRLNNSNVSERRKLRRYEDAIKDESPPKVEMVEAIYNEAGLVFPEAVKTGLEDAKTFHVEIVKNRKAFLESEISRLTVRIKNRDEQIQELSEERAVKMQILSTHGALDERDKLQENHLKVKERLEKVKGKIEDIKTRTVKKKEIKAQKMELEKMAEIHYEETRPKWEEAVRIFAENSQSLYKKPGSLVINIKEDGYKFQVKLSGDKGGGIGKMKTFCYDLMLAQLQQDLSRNIDFLVHDSIVYEVTDPRQRALALELAAQKAEEHGFQYICTLNSDTVPYEEFSEDFNFEDYVRLRLKDGDPAGSLLGIRY